MIDSWEAVNKPFHSGISNPAYLPAATSEARPDRRCRPGQTSYSNRVHHSDGKPQLDRDGNLDIKGNPSAPYINKTLVPIASHADLCSMFTCSRENIRFESANLVMPADP